ncbi:RNase adapter RapZ [Methylomagnum ishizawai]|uniref:RNase adapter RapZ n=1 Tax=Methylomagnum ishizawai TaxID=1760988 RepID=UPI001C334558|nr:RNase adapter RapZ [Methylomagnum ishizawai]BBL76037.1 nucleotide-binding protein [Methylomagnum ishizawai]
MNLVIVSGLSGSGKSIALETLEDCGYYCIDNLPVVLFESFVRRALIGSHPPLHQAAIGIDARNQTASLAQFPSTLELADQFGIECRILFLQAESHTLLKRFSETRRKHPLTSANHPLSEAIELERQLLEPVASRAHLLIDTTYTNVHQLRELVRQRVAAKRENLMSLYFLSFGYKNGMPLDADFVFDLRCLPNPHWEPALRAKTGKDAEVVEFLERIDDVRQYLEDVAHFLERWIPRFKAENRSYLTVAIGCTGGQHRSVYLVEALAARFASSDHHLLVRHRDLR